MSTSVPGIAAALEQVGPRLQRLRGQRGMSLSEVAAATGISKSTVSRLETGQRRPSLYLVGISPLAFAIGAIVRHSAGALATVLGLLLVVDVMFRMVPADLFRQISPFLPGTAGHQLLATQATLDHARATTTAPVLGPWTGYGVMLAWVAVLLAAAALLLRRRDA